MKCFSIELEKPMHINGGVDVNASEKGDRIRLGGSNGYDGSLNL